MRNTTSFFPAKVSIFNSRMRPGIPAHPPLEKRNMKRAMALWILALVTLHGLAVEAQQTGKVPRIGFLDPTSRAVSNARVEAFRQALGKLGYTEGKNIAIDYRFADGKSQLLKDVASELVRLNVNIIVTRATPGAVAAKQATATIPIVFVGVADALAAGLVTTLRHPGGNITGLTSLSPELSGKRLELLKETFPKVSRVVVLREIPPMKATLLYGKTRKKRLRL
jgi:putative ABC transport system substrate-binding protein